ncbi:MAG: hypothetical protein ACRDYY_04410 [Acidimicrobiales bacterium]
MVVSAKSSPGEPLTDTTRRQVVNGLVGELPQRSQILLRLLSTNSPLSYKEIGEALSMPVGSIGPTRLRALGQLKRLALNAGLHVQDVLVA